jgi:hypothetical protein
MATMTSSKPEIPANDVCHHEPSCPGVEASDRDAAHVIAAHPEQGWSLLCNGIVLFEDFGELLPSGESCAARRSELLMASPHRRAS